jgi:hypothetical protein
MCRRRRYQHSNLDGAVGPPMMSGSNHASLGVNDDRQCVTGNAVLALSQWRHRHLAGALTNGGVGVWTVEHLRGDAVRHGWLVGRDGTVRQQQARHAFVAAPSYFRRSCGLSPMARKLTPFPWPWSENP